MTQDHVSWAKDLAKRITDVGEAILRAAEPGLGDSRGLTSARDQPQTRLLNGEPDSLHDVLRSGPDTLRQIADEIGELVEAAE